MRVIIYNTLYIIVSLLFCDLALSVVVNLIGHKPSLNYQKAHPYHPYCSRLALPLFPISPLHSLYNCYENVRMTPSTINTASYSVNCLNKTKEMTFCFVHFYLFGFLL